MLKEETKTKRRTSGKDWLFSLQTEVEADERLTGPSGEELEEDEIISLVSPKALSKQEQN